MFLDEFKDQPNDVEKSLKRLTDAMKAKADQLGIPLEDLQANVVINPADILGLPKR